MIHLMYKHHKTQEQANTIYIQVKAEAEILYVNRRAEMVRSCCQMSAQLKNQIQKSFFSLRTEDMLNAQKDDDHSANDPEQGNRLDLIQKEKLEQLKRTYPPLQIDRMSFIDHMFIVDVETTGNIHFLIHFSSFSFF